MIDNGGNSVEIGNNVAIACNVKILTTNHDFSNSNKRAGKVKGKKVKIGDGCWIGAGSIILPGTEIGKGTIVAAGSVVKGEIEENSLYAGIPAKKIRSLQI